MKCENYFCIYEDNGFCLLDRIELDIQGQCTECTYLSIDEESLRYLKARERLALEESDAEHP